MAVPKDEEPLGIQDSLGHLQPPDDSSTPKQIHSDVAIHPDLAIQSDIALKPSEEARKPMPVKRKKERKEENIREKPPRCVLIIGAVVAVVGIFSLLFFVGVVSIFLVQCC